MELRSFFKREKTNLRGKLVLITGAAQGIGLHTASEFANAGANLILTDINAEKLAEAQQRLSRKGVKIETYTVNVADKDAVQALAHEVIKNHGKLDVLINNAGIGHHAELEDTSLETWEKLINVNFWGSLFHIYAFLPAMKEAGKGHIVNVSSGQAFFRMPTWGAYAAIKLAMGVISEIMHYELKRYNIKVTTVYPYMVNTGFYNEVETDTIGAKLSMLLLPFYSQKPETVASIIFKAVSRGKRVEMVNPLNTVGKYLNTFPISSDILNKLLTFFLSESNEKLIEKIPGLQMAIFAIMSLNAKVQDAAGEIGFKMDEIMQGEHEFENGFGPEGKKRMVFKVRWGTNQIIEWLNPFSDNFMVNDLEGTVSIDGLCEDAACEGKLELKYFTEQKIRYQFEFDVEDETYEFIGEKRNIYPWNLPYSHTCCFGELRLKGSDKIISKSITHFRLDTLPEFLSSFQIVK
jgi:short-subunit dehydrogenase